MTLARQTTILLWVLYAATAIVTQYINPTNGTNPQLLYCLWTLQCIVLLVIPLLYRYFLYQYCGCCEKVTLEATDTAHPTGNETLAQPLIESAGTEAQNQPTDTTPRQVRYPFLDNVKVFLTAVVVFHHVTCAILGYMLINVGSKLEAFNFFLGGLLGINQGYFMSLFFFISAFFVPTSFAKGRKKFLRSKWKRILLPALVGTFVIYPIGFLFIGHYNDGASNYGFFLPAQTWYLYWLLLLNWVYMSIVESRDTSPTSSTDDNGIEVEMAQERQEPRMPFPSTWTRLLYGVTFCGIVLQAFKYLLQDSVILFLTMPEECWGSFTADFLMFYAGILARKHGWLEKDLAEQLDIPLYVLFPMVLVEIIVYSVSASVFSSSRMGGFLEALAAGAYCVDMSLAVLIIFQRWFNYETKLSKVLARSAYCVFLIHILVLMVVTIAYLEFYKSVFGTGEIGRVVGGWVFVNVATQAIVWPLSYGLTRLPVLRDII